MSAEYPDIDGPRPDFMRRAGKPVCGSEHLECRYRCLYCLKIDEISDRNTPSALELVGQNAI